eukprot:Tbor_TRINITY_DN3141_c0_g1::TRINITY_DN3141_c0_g1_i1::g.14739::m.14739
MTHRMSSTGITKSSTSPTVQKGPHKSSLFAGQRSREGPTNTRQSSNNGNGKKLSKFEEEDNVRKENDALVGALTEDITRLREGATFLRNEVADHNRLIESIQIYMQSARDGVVGSIGKVDKVMGRYGMKHTIIFALVMCIVLYLLITLGKGLFFPVVKDQLSGQVKNLSEK